MSAVRGFRDWRGVRAFPGFRGYRALAWWLWATTALALSAGVLGWTPGFDVAIALTCVHLIASIDDESSLLSLPVQVRAGFLLVLLAMSPPPLHPLYWLPAIGAWVRVGFDYCIMARLLLLLPWNRSERFSADLVWRTFVSGKPPRS